MTELVKWHNKAFKVPDGFKAVDPATVPSGRLVYVVGTNQGKPHAYGPHVVVDAGKAILKRGRDGREFKEKTSHWLVPA